jgi:hypothetical protein
MGEKLRIVLSTSNPVLIDEERWPSLCSGTSYRQLSEGKEGIVEAHVFIGVHQHRDGRTIVYGVFDRQCLSSKGQLQSGGEKHYAGDRWAPTINVSGAIRGIAKHLIAQLHATLFEAAGEDCINEAAEDCIDQIPAEELL